MNSFSFSDAVARVVESLIEPIVCVHVCVCVCVCLSLREIARDSEENEA